VRACISLRIPATLLVAFGAVLAVSASATAQSFSASAAPSSALSIPLASQITPDQLQKLIEGPLADQPLILHVGSHSLFVQSHIPYATYTGLGSQPEGLDELAHAVAPIPKDHFIVIYCGCCPWDHCPNIAPAFHKLQELGFTNVKALYLATSFAEDWVAKGYPVQKAL
jgi:thiosulfate/3-mercaptopyruvate sulfurtransferase